jgi:hypothetical protein
MIKKNDKPFELRNIKTNPSGYQIQFIVNGKSHSGFSTDIEEAKKIRNKMEKELNVGPQAGLRRRPSEKKLTFIPGTNKPMAAGISMRCGRRKPTRSETYTIIIDWRDHTGRKRLKSFYGCSESRYTRKKLKEAYDLALKFRLAYEEAIRSNTLEDFNPSAFNRKRPKRIKRTKVLMRKRQRIRR